MDRETIFLDALQDYLEVFWGKINFKESEKI